MKNRDEFGGDTIQKFDRTNRIIDLVERSRCIFFLKRFYRISSTLSTGYVCLGTKTRIPVKQPKQIRAEQFRISTVVDEWKIPKNSNRKLLDQIDTSTRDRRNAEHQRFKKYRKTLGKRINLNRNSLRTDECGDFQYLPQRSATGRVTTSRQPFRLV